jgi:hypothetical protein
LRACFNRENTKFGSRTDPHGYALDLSHDELLLPMNLGSEWPERPLFRTFLDKVTVLKLDNTRFSGKANGLLKDFPNLRELSQWMRADEPARKHRLNAAARTPTPERQ